jgi:hypothetical protein
MTRAQINHQVAARTGEPLALVRRLGFQLQRERHEEPAADDLRLVVHCPFCLGTVPYPGRSRDGSAVMAECVACDVYFEAEDRDVFLASSSELASRSPAHRRHIPA